MRNTAARTLRICSLATLLSASVTPPAVAEAFPQLPIEYVKKLSFGNLRKLYLKGGNGEYSLNDCPLPRVVSDSIELATKDQSFRVRATFLATVLVAKSHPVNAKNTGLLQGWAQRIPVVAEILGQKDAVGSMKPVVYDLLSPSGRKDLELQEELVLLWSASPADNSKIGLTSLLPPKPFPGQLVDVQYRGLKKSAEHLVGKIVLQILYIREEHRPAVVLGGFVIVSKPSGEYEFYGVPQNLLDRILLGSK